MSAELIEQALTTATDTKAILIGRNVLRRTGELFKETFPGARVLVVADENTYGAAGDPVSPPSRPRASSSPRSPTCSPAPRPCTATTTTSRFCGSTPAPSRTR